MLCTLGWQPERPFFPGLYLIIVNSYKAIIIPNHSLNPAHSIAVGQAKLQLKDQMRVVLPFKLTTICRPKRSCLTWGLTRGSSTHTCLTWGLTRHCSTCTCLTWGITRYRTYALYIVSIMLLALSPACCVAPVALVQFLVASINLD